MDQRLTLLTKSCSARGYKPKLVGEACDVRRTRSTLEHHVLLRGTRKMSPVVWLNGLGTRVESIAHPANISQTFFAATHPVSRSARQSIATLLKTQKLGSRHARRPAVGVTPDVATHQMFNRDGALTMR